MARYIDEEILINGINNRVTNSLIRGWLASIIDETPTADVVEVPCRCKECKYVEWFDDAIIEHRHYFCELANHQLVDADGYCYKGERKCDNG